MNNTTVVMGSAAPAVSVVRFGESPVMMTCPTCRNTITTNTSHDVGGMAWLLCLVLFFVGWVILDFENDSRQIPVLESAVTRVHSVNIAINCWIFESPNGSGLTVLFEKEFFS